MRLFTVQVKDFFKVYIPLQAIEQPSNSIIQNLMGYEL